MSDIDDDELSSELGGSDVEAVEDRVRKAGQEMVQQGRGGGEVP